MNNKKASPKVRLFCYRYAGFFPCSALLLAEKIESLTFFTS